MTFWLFGCWEMVLSQLAASKRSKSTWLAILFSETQRLKTYILLVVFIPLQAPNPLAPNSSQARQMRQIFETTSLIHVSQKHIHIHTYLHIWLNYNHLPT
jgi:hypothetical protein